MRQADLDRAVARAMGETVSAIKRLGFLMANPTESLDPDFDWQGPNVIDGIQRNVASTLAAAKIAANKKGKRKKGPRFRSGQQRGQRATKPGRRRSKRKRRRR